jgi:hypothetical protein
MMNVVTFKAPKFKPMPGELTPAVINGATLPVKVEAAKRAIAACCDLSELLTWKDKLAALAAAAKMARMPEMARDVNRVHKEALLRMGEILLQYKGTHGGHKGEKISGKGTTPSERTIVAKSLGIPKSTVTGVCRLAKAPKSVIRDILDNDAMPPNALKMGGAAPRTSKVNYGHNTYTDSARIFFTGRKTSFGNGGTVGMTSAAACLRNTDLSVIPQMTNEEKRRARKLVVEMQEILDDIDRRLGPDTSVEPCS